MNNKGDGFLVRIIHRKNQVACWTEATQEVAVAAAKAYLGEHPQHAKYEVIDFKRGVVAEGGAE